MLWRLGGPTSIARVSWFEDYGLVSKAVKNGHLQVVEWMQRAAITVSIPIHWKPHLWKYAAAAGHTKVLGWAIAQGHLTTLGCSAALLSTCNGDSTIAEWWITTQSSRRKALSALQSVHVLAMVTKAGAVCALDWWWTNIGMQLPSPTAMAEIATTALASKCLTVVEWWWMRFVKYRTPEHTFGDRPFDIGHFTSVAILDWFYMRSQESKECFPQSPELNPHGLSFTINTRTTLPILQWAMEKCANLDGQKLQLMSNFVDLCASAGDVAMLDLALKPSNVLVVEWTANLVSNVLQSRSVAVLEWWELHRDELPPQNLDCSSHLPRATVFDSVDLIAWWYAQQLPIRKLDWQKVFHKAIQHNSRRMQLWLHDHVALFAPESDHERRQFISECIPVLRSARPFTLYFFDAVFPDMGPLQQIPEHALHSITVLHWWCTRAKISIASLLPLKSHVFQMLLNAGNIPMLELWLQEHLAANQRLVFPAKDELDEIFQFEEGSHQWMYDATVTRKIPAFVVSGSKIVPYTAPGYPSSQ
ncbi:hypothetical protein BC828DRAFT_380963 [Blastocladiella britannica]|nr:hypothetical protein BC828DRAFT_380963 [Blastocladiella britannica]